MSDLSDLDAALSRPLPQNPDAERAVLGSALLNAHAFYRVMGIIDTEDFFKESNRQIFAAMRELAEKSQAIDTLTVKDELAKRGQLEAIGGAAYVSMLTDMVPDIANVERYARIVKEKSTLRRLIIMGNSVMRTALDPMTGSGDALGMAEQEIFAIAEGSTEGGFVPLPKIIRENMNAVEQLYMNRGAAIVTGIPTGYDRFNEFTGGFQKSDLIIIAARPSMGKTSLALNIAEAIAVPDRNGDPPPGLDRLYGVGLFSLEMSKAQVGLRLLSSVAGVSSHLLRSGMLSDKNMRELGEAASRLSKSAIHVHDSAGIDVMEIRATARRLRHEATLDLVLVDYLQLMAVKGRTENRNQEVSQISRGLKAVAKELALPVVALSQLSRRPEQRTSDHRPQLSDLRESGSIEQDADLVAFIYRDEVYNKETEQKGIAEIIISKQRNGPIGDFKLVFRNDITKFFNYEPSPDFMPE